VKKKSSSRKASARTAAASPKVGGTRRGSKAPEWSNVGRRRKDEDSPLADLASELKSLRESKKISVTSIAKKLDVAPATIIKFEDRNHPVSIGVVLGIAESLGYTLNLSKKKGRK